MIAYFDCGTTNTRIYIINNGHIIYEKKVEKGTRDAVHGELQYEKLLKELYQTALSKIKILNKDIYRVYASGMITSSSGLYEVQHVSLPAGIEVLRNNMVTYNLKNEIGKDLTLIPGMKTCGQNLRLSPDECVDVNNIRGEEMEIFGVNKWAVMNKIYNYALVLPGSHTQTAFVKNGTVNDLFSCISGELFDAITKHTFIGASVCENDCQINVNEVGMGARLLEKYGLNRALYLVRTLEIFSDTSASERMNVLEGIIHADIVKGVLAKLDELKDITNIIIYGNTTQASILEILFEMYARKGYYIFVLDLPVQASVMGVCELDKREGV